MTLLNHQTAIHQDLILRLDLLNCEEQQAMFLQCINPHSKNALFPLCLEKDQLHSLMEVRGMS